MTFKYGQRVRYRGLIFGFTFIYIAWFCLTKIYDKRDDFDFEIVNFTFLDCDVPRSTSYGVYISQVIRFARVSSHVDDFNTRSKVLTANFSEKDIDII